MGKLSLIVAAFTIIIFINYKRNPVYVVYINYSKKFANCHKLQILVQILCQGLSMQSSLELLAIKFLRKVLALFAQFSVYQ